MRRVAWLGWLPLLGALGCPKPPAPAPPPPAAFYWEAHGPGGAQLFLQGSVHLGAERQLALPMRVEMDWLRAEELIVEVDVQGLPDLERLDAVQRHGLLPPELTLRAVVAPATWDALVAYLGARYYPLAAASRMRPWLLAQLIAQFEFEDAGLVAENGVDAWFLRRAAQDRKPVGQLESLEEQMAAFGTLAPPVEEALLREVLGQTDVFLAVTRAILAAWERGDEALLLELLLGSRNDPLLASFHRSVFVSRNHRMASRLAALAADGRPRFVVVGAGHLIGPESVPALLAAYGFEVERHPDAFVRRVPPVPVLPAQPEGAAGAAPAPPP